MPAELRQTLRVQLHQMPAAASGSSRGTSDFPEYYEDSVENTPARIVSIETHGCGIVTATVLRAGVPVPGFDELFRMYGFRSRKNW